MKQERVYIPSTDNTQVALDTYVTHVSNEIDPDIRRPAILVCPGGGYAFCSEREAEPVALRFAALGFNTFVVWYRVAPNRFPKPQQDAAAAMAYIRKNAEALHTDPNRIAILGFSAGGHLAGSIGTMWQRAELWEELGLTCEDVRPNAMVLCYPVLVSGRWAHQGSFENLTGCKDWSVHEAYSLDKLVDGKFCPPAFLWHTFNDTCVPVQNSLAMAQALRENGVGAEVHIFPEGPHGLSLASEETARNADLIQPDCQCWPELAARFLKKAM